MGRAIYTPRTVENWRQCAQPPRYYRISVQILALRTTPIVPLTDDLLTAKHPDTPVFVVVSRQSMEPAELPMSEALSHQRGSYR